MSNPLSASENTLFTTSLRHANRAPSHDALASSPSESKAVTIPKVDSDLPKTNSTQKKGWSKEQYAEGRGKQRVSDDVLFLDSAANTPRLPPSRYGSNDLQFAPSHDLTMLDESNIPLSSASPYSSHLHKSPPPPSALSPRGALVTSFSEVNLRAFCYLQNPLRHDLTLRDKAFPQNRISPSPLVGNKTPNRNFSPQLNPHRTRSQGAMDEPDNTRAAVETVDNQGNENVHRERSVEQAEGAAVENKRNRSSSRNGKVEKRIEATLAKAEPGPAARSRKSSHLLGLFKENAVQEPKKPAEKVSHPLSSEPESKKDTFRPSADELLENEHVSNRDRKQSGESIITSQQNGEQLGLSTGDQAMQEKLGNDERGVDYQLGDGKSPLPPDLMSDVREHQLTIPTATAADSRKLRSPQKMDRPGQDIEGYVDAMKSPTTEPPTEQKRPETIAEVEGEEDSDKEEILSALYYPHQAPSPDANEHTADLRPLSNAKSAPKGLRRPTDPETTDAEEDDVLSEEVDIALQSNNKQRYLHGDLPKSSLPSDDAPAFDSGLSSASESDYESLDEGGRSASGDERNALNDGEATPKASPGAYPSFLRSRSRKRRGRLAAPFNVVELKPYKHQVGGHSTVYKFSERAVCKPLSNRENEFYEVIEQDHRELLKFLPKYIGVLNVTIGVKRQKALANAENQPKEEEAKATPGNSGEASQTVRMTDETASADGTNNTTDQPRIVSHSQTIGPVPQVIFANNRHIIPDGLFKLPPQSDPTSYPVAGDSAQPQVNQASTTTPIVNTQISAANDDGESKAPNSRHVQSPNWGYTTVNTRLREQVLREVFSPPVIYRHDKQGRNSNTLPRVRETTDPTQSRHSRPSILRQDNSFSAVSSGAGKKPVRRNSILGKEPNQVSDKPHPNGGEDRVNDHVSDKVIDTVKTSSTSTESVPIPASRRVKRRHSGSGLRSKQNDVDSDKRSALEYHEDKDLGGEENDDLFAMELEKFPTQAKSPDATITDGAHGNDKSKGSLVSQIANDPNIPKHDEKSPIPQVTQQPANPEQAKTQLDERMELFILLEDLTAGMNKPCVLDLKMGTRQYGIDADEKKKQGQRRKCMVTTSQQLGVRLCGMQTWDMKEGVRIYKDKYSGRDIKAGPEFQDSLKQYLYDGISNASILQRVPAVIERISKLDKIIRGLPGYRFYASSLLLLYDAQPAREDDKATNGDTAPTAPSRVELKLIDFANCVTAEDRLTESTRCPPHDPEGIDRGYLRGLRTLRLYLLRIYQDVCAEQGDTANGNGSDEATTMERELLEEVIPPGWNDSAFDEDLGNKEVSVTNASFWAVNQGPARLQPQSEDAEDIGE
ncbi:MAG: hypothetical protein Q9218_006704 [Villophora microphyllina]